MPTNPSPQQIAAGDDPCDQQPCLQDMHGIWHVKTEASPGVRLSFADVSAIMPAVMSYFEETSHA